MIWAHKPRDPWRWHCRFALRPRRIGERWIWLERFAWRPLPPDEIARHRGDGAAVYVPTLPGTWECWHEFALPCGYAAVRQQEGCGAGMILIWHNTWRRPVPREVAA